jgi:hypothetical protein
VRYTAGNMYISFRYNLHPQSLFLKFFDLVFKYIMISHINFVPEFAYGKQIIFTFLALYLMIICFFQGLGHCIWNVAAYLTFQKGSNVVCWHQ